MDTAKNFNAYENNDFGLSDILNKLTDNIDISLDDFKLAGESIKDSITFFLNAMKNKSIKSISIDKVNVLEIKNDNEFIVLFGGNLKKSNTIEGIASRFEKISNKIEGKESYSQNTERIQKSIQKTNLIEKVSILFNTSIKDNNYNNGNWDFSRFKNK